MLRIGVDKVCKSFFHSKSNFCCEKNSKKAPPLYHTGAEPNRLRCLWIFENVCEKVCDKI